jgi:hypothetical protein
METKKTDTVIPVDLLADLEAICRQAAGGGPKDAELVRRIQEIGVQIIREMRDRPDA